MYIGLQVQYRCYSCQILMKLEFSRQFLFENIQISNFMKIRPMWAQIFHADEQTDIRDEGKRRFSKFREHTWNGRRLETFKQKMLFRMSGSTGEQSFSICLFSIIKTVKNLYIFLVVPFFLRFFDKGILLDTYTDSFHTCWKFTSTVTTKWTEQKTS
jgi:hypothetical protein